MAANRDLRLALLNQLGISRQVLSQRVAREKALNGPMSTEDGVYVLAHRSGLDIAKYLDSDTVDRVRGLLQGRSSSVAPSAPTPRRSRSAATSRSVKIAPEVEAVDAMLPLAIAKDASRMATVYARMYVLENSVRTVILRVLRAEHGSDWWRTCAPTGVQREVANRKQKEANTPWHGKRGTHEIYYSDFSDLRDIITKNWTDFEAILPSQPWITQRLEELEAPRNIVAHNNPLSKQEENRLDVYFGDWIELIRDRRDLVP